MVTSGDGERDHDGDRRRPIGRSTLRRRTAFALPVVAVVGLMGCSSDRAVKTDTTATSSTTTSTVSSTTGGVIGNPPPPTTESTNSVPYNPPITRR